jgi:hypothetical protein
MAGSRRPVRGVSDACACPTTGRRRTGDRSGLGGMTAVHDGSGHWEPIVPVGPPAHLGVERPDGRHSARPALTPGRAHPPTASGRLNRFAGAELGDAVIGGRDPWASRSRSGRFVEPVATARVKVSAVAPGTGERVEVPASHDRSRACGSRGRRRRGVGDHEYDRPSGRHVATDHLEPAGGVGGLFWRNVVAVGRAPVVNRRDGSGGRRRPGSTGRTAGGRCGEAS